MARDLFNSRRVFLKTLAVSAGSTFVSDGLFATQETATLPVSCNQYSWVTFYAREGRDWHADLDKSLGEYASTGLAAFEPALNHVDEVGRLLPLAAKYGLAIPSVYVNTSLHQAEEAAKSITTVLAIAKALKTAGTKIIATNPNPIQWGGAKNKSDEELTEQAVNLDKLGAALKRIGMVLAYHTHDVELRAAAREFHHMLLATDPKHVSLCLDVHWIYRGSGNSQIALFDVVKLYGKRIVELHLRQSKDGIWQETFGEGDINYPRLMHLLESINSKPLLVLEQCLEKDSPRSLNAMQAHKVDLAYLNTLTAN